MDPMPEDWQRAVAVVAHPDDIEYGAATAVALWTSQGKEVSYVLATSGEAGIDGIVPDRVGPLREQEERRSATVVGVRDVAFLGYPDGAIEYGLALRKDLAAEFRRLRPEIVLTMNFELTWGQSGSINHADHRAVGLAALDACRDAANRWFFPDLGEPWKGITGIYVCATATPTHFVDVESTIDLGVASLREHRAYLAGLGGDFDPDGFLRGIATSSAQAVGCELAVLFQRFGV